MSLSDSVFRFLGDSGGFMIGTLPHGKRLKVYTNIFIVLIFKYKSYLLTLFNSMPW